MGVLKLFSKKMMNMSKDEFDTAVGTGRPADSIADVLKDIYNEKRFGEYAGGALTFSLEREGEHYNIIFMNINKCLYEDEEFWLSMCYLKYKSPTHAFWEDSISCIILYAEKYNQQTEAAKLMLLNGDTE